MCESSTLNLAPFKHTVTVNLTSAKYQTNAILDESQSRIMEQLLFLAFQFCRQLLAQMPRHQVIFANERVTFGDRTQ